MQLNSLFKHWSYRIIAPGTLLREKYEALKKLLQHDIRCHEEMAELQDLLHLERREDLVTTRHRLKTFSSEVKEMIAALDTMDPGTYQSLKAYHKKFDFYISFLLAPPQISFAPPYVLPLAAIGEQSNLLGNKAKHLGILAGKIGAPVPPGFAITSGGYHYLIEYNDLRRSIDDELLRLDIYDPKNLEEISQSLTSLIVNAELPPKLLASINEAAAELEKQRQFAGHLAKGRQLRLAVRSSAINEDGEHSFAGQYATVLSVTRDEIAKAYLKVLASKYSPEAIYYRVHNGMGDEETAMAVFVQEMVDADCSGVLYTASALDATSDQLHLHLTSGLGEALVSGSVNPEYYPFSRETAAAGTELEACGQVPAATVKQLADLALAIEEYFGVAQDIEWALDKNGSLYILQARELHLQQQEELDPAEVIDVMPVIADCECASHGIFCGKIHYLDSLDQLASIPDGSVLVTRDSPPELVRVMAKIGAVLSERGSRASHFATVAREFGVPFLTGEEAWRRLFSVGEEVTVDGYHGRVWRGRVEALLQDQQGGLQTDFADSYHKTLREALKFVTPLELTDPAAANFSPEGCRSMHDIIRFCHEKALLSMFTTGKPGTGRGSLRFNGDIPLDVFLFDVGGGIVPGRQKKEAVSLEMMASRPFTALWKGLSHPGVQWKQKPFDWDAYDKIELAGGVPPKKDSFAFASYAVVGKDYLHFNLRFGYHFTIVDVLCGEKPVENHCMLRFAGGGGDFTQLSLRIDFLAGVLTKLGFAVLKKGDLLEAKSTGLPEKELAEKLDMLGRLLGASKLMDMVLEDEQMVADCVADFYNGRYSFSEEG